MARLLELSQEQLIQLPIRGLMAFLACRARAVLPWFDFLEGDPEAKIGVPDLEGVVRILERFGNGGAVSEAECCHARSVAEAAIQGSNTETSVEAGNVLLSCVQALALAIAFPTDKSEIARQAEGACLVSLDEMQEVDFNEDAIEEYERLLKAAQAGNWTDDTPVSPEFF